MKIFKSLNAFTAWNNKNAALKVGLVPTMGALHQGHISLIDHSVQSCDITVISIFVNQLQFSPNEDFQKYPRNINADIKLLKNYNVDAVLIPTQNEMYKKNFSYQVSDCLLSKKLEGKSRPHFFIGVCTVVCKLFNVVKPTHAYFGMKDVQQLYVIKKMVSDLNYQIKIKGVPTVREKNGLAMSSRNKYLSEREKNAASIIYKIIKVAKKMIVEKPRSIKTVKLKIEKLFLEKNFKIDYVSVSSLDNFEEILTYQKNKTVISVAIIYKKVRLIDNVII